MSFFGKIENMLNKKKKVQRIGEIRPNPWITQTEIDRDKLVQVDQL